MLFSIEIYCKHKTCFNDILLVAASEKGIIPLFFVVVFLDITYITQYITYDYRHSTEPDIASQSLKNNCSQNFVRNNLGSAKPLKKLVK